MESITKSLATHSGEVLVGLLLLLLALSILTLSLWRTVNKLQSRWRELLSGSGQNLEALLYDHLRGRMVLEEQVAKLELRADRSEQLAESAKRFIGLVKYDAFDDVGGNQSFALAVYDDRGDGAVLSSIVGRDTCRVYCKPIQGGRSERDLSSEETRAIREARAVGPKAIVSP